MDYYFWKTIFNEMFVFSTANMNLRPPQSPRGDAGLRFQQPITPPSSSNPHTPASPHMIAQHHPHSRYFWILNCIVNLVC